MGISVLPHQCNYCDKRFNRLNDERAHTIYAKWEPHQCSCCGKTSAKNGSTHKKEKLYQCDYCHKLFSTTCQWQTLLNYLSWLVISSCKDPYDTNEYEKPSQFAKTLHNNVREQAIKWFILTVTQMRKHNNANFVEKHQYSNHVTRKVTWDSIPMCIHNTHNLCDSVRKLKILHIPLRESKWTLAIRSLHESRRE